MSFVKSKMFIGSLLIIGIVAGSVGGYLLLNQAPVQEAGIRLTLLENAGVMIEAEGLRIYIDPYRLPDNYTDYPADAILVTHTHGDHYQVTSIDKIATDDTIFIFPENMSTEIARHDGIGVNPGDSVQVGTINITAFYMYTFPPEGTDYEATHPRENNFTSYIIDINGFTLFHAGDAKNLDEYDQLRGTIDVAMLPLGPGCQTMCDDEVVDALRAIRPNYFIPIHFTDGANDDFCDTYGNQIEYLDIQIQNLDHFEACVFEEDSE